MNPNKLEDMVELVIHGLQKQGMLPGKMPEAELFKIQQKIMEILLAKGDAIIKESGFFLKPGDPLSEQTRQLNMFNMLFLTVTAECLKHAGFKPLFGEKALDPKTQALLEKLNKALLKLKDAKNPNEAEAAFDEVMKLCDELTKRADLKPTLKIQIEMAKMIAHQMRNQVYLEHHAEHLLAPHPEMKHKEEDDEFSTYLRNLYGGVDPRFGGAVSEVVVSVSNDFGYGADNAGDANDMSAVAEANRYDFRGDSGGRENTVLQKLIGLGGSILETVREAGLLTPTPTNTPE